MTKSEFQDGSSVTLESKKSSEGAGHEDDIVIPNLLPVSDAFKQLHSEPNCIPPDAGSPATRFPRRDDTCFILS